MRYCSETADGHPRTVSLNIVLNRRAVAGPPGAFMAVPTSDDLEPPGLTELGGRVRLLYVDAEDAEAQGL
jgi:hypothetical protein